MNKPLFIITAVTSDGLQDAWAISAMNKLEVVDYILQNLKDYKKLLSRLPIAVSPKELTADDLFTAIAKSQVDFNNPYVINIYQIPEDKVAMA